MVDGMLKSRGSSVSFCLSVSVCLSVSCSHTFCLSQPLSVFLRLSLSLSLSLSLFLTDFDPNYMLLSYTYFIVFCSFFFFFGCLQAQVKKKVDLHLLR